MAKPIEQRYCSADWFDRYKAGEPAMCPWCRSPTTTRAATGNTRKAIAYVCSCGQRFRMNRG